MPDNRPFQQKLPEFQQELQLLMKKYSILIFPIIEPHPHAFIAVIKAVDDNDVEAKKKFGVEASPMQGNKANGILVN